MKEKLKHKNQSFTHHVAVNAYLIDKNKFLLLERSSPVSLWSPPGGKLRLSEDPILGLKREVKEETQLEVEVHEPVTTWFGMFNGKMLLSIDYLCTVIKGDITLSSEHCSYRWLTIAELESRADYYFTTSFGFKISDFILAWKVYLMREKRYQELIYFNDI